MDSKQEFVVVYLTEEDSIEVVPNIWVNSGVCFWPPVTDKSKIEKMVLNFEKPKKQWFQVDAKILLSTESYEEARRMRKNSECKSSLSNYSSDASDFERDEYAQQQVVGRGSSFLSHKNVENRSISPQPGPSFAPAAPPQKNRNSAGISISPLVHLAKEKRRMNVYSSSSPLSSSSSDDGENQAFQKKVFRILEMIREDIAELKKMMRNKNISRNSNMPDCPLLPINSPDMLSEFNRYLENKEKFSQMCTYFGSFDGINCNGIVKQILESILTNQLGMLYNWKGRGGMKLGFCQFQSIIQLVSNSVRNNPNFKQVTDMEIETAMKRWLAYAKERAERARKT